MKRKICGRRSVVVLVVVGLFILFFIDFSSYTRNGNYLQLAKEATSPNRNFLFAKNVLLTSRIGMTYFFDSQKCCINTATAFYNKYHTCSNCEDFVGNPKKWNFVPTVTPKLGDLVIYINDEGRAHHAAVIVDIKNGEYYINHANGDKYIKNERLKKKGSKLFYRFITDKS